MSDKLLSNIFLRFKSGPLNDLLYYGLSNSINRGFQYLSLPFLTIFLTVEEFGVYSLILVIVSLLVPFVSLNMSEAILREGLENKGLGYYLLLKYRRLSILISVSLTIVSLLFVNSIQWLPVLFMLAGTEAVFILNLTWVRANDRGKQYLILSIIKSTIILVTYVTGYLLNISLLSLLILQTILNLILILIQSRQLETPIGEKYKIEWVKEKSIIIYSLFLLPHIVSQWAMSGIDRAVIKFYLPSYDLGIYSIGYTIAMSLMIINSALSMTLISDLIKKYDHWLNTLIRTKYIFYYSIIIIICVVLIYIGFYLDKEYLKVLNYQNANIYKVFNYVIIGIYYLGTYLFYTNYLFYNRKTKLLSSITFITAIFNFILTVILTKSYGIIGASIATLLTYLFYLILIVISVNQLGILRKKYLLYDAIIIFITSVFLFLISWTFLNHLLKY